jgi:hypothetical protein
MVINCEITEYYFLLKFKVIGSQISFNISLGNEIPKIAKDRVPGKEEMASILRKVALLVRFVIA